MVIETLGMSEC